MGWASTAAAETESGALKLEFLTYHLMQDDLRYFHVTGGAVLAAHRRFIATRTTQGAARRAERDKWGATGIFANSQGVAGLFFQDDEEVKSGPVPEGWQQVVSMHNVYAPDVRTKAGKAIMAEWKKLRFANAEDFQAGVLGKRDPFYFMEFPSVRYMTYELVDDKVILLVPKTTIRQTACNNAATGKGHKWQPPDAGCVELKASEYWKLKEDAESTTPFPLQ